MSDVLVSGSREGAQVSDSREGAPEETSALPEGVLVARVGAGANCSSAGSAIDILFYTSVIAGAVAIALSAAFPPRPAQAAGPSDGLEGRAGRRPARRRALMRGGDPRDKLR